MCVLPLRVMRHLAFITRMISKHLSVRVPNSYPSTRSGTTHLPEADGLFIGGGFPETQLEALAANTSLLTEIREALAAGKPAYAECGGLMYLSRRISWAGKSARWSGPCPLTRLSATARKAGVTCWSGNPATARGRSHGNASDRGASDIPAHEFHYARLRNLGDRPDHCLQRNTRHRYRRSS